MFKGRLKLTVAAVALTLVAASAGAVLLAQGRGPHGGGFGLGFGPFGFRGMGLLAAALDLTDEQQTQIKGILSQHRDEFRAIAQQVRPKRDALQEAIVAGDEATIRARVTDLTQAGGDAAVVASKVHAEVMQVLTPEQQQKASELRERFKGRVGERWRERGFDF